MKEQTITHMCDVTVAKYVGANLKKGTTYSDEMLLIGTINDIDTAKRLINKELTLRYNHGGDTLHACAHVEKLTHKSVLFAMRKQDFITMATVVPTRNKRANPVTKVTNNAVKEGNN